MMCAYVHLYVMLLNTIPKKEQDGLVSYRWWEREAKRPTVKIATWFKQVTTGDIYMAFPDAFMLHNITNLIIV